MKKYRQYPAVATGAMILALGGLVLPALGGEGEVETGYITATNPAATNTFMGMVGVGTGSPASRFHVAGDSKMDGGLTVSGAMKVPKQGDVSMGAYTNGESGGGVSGAGGRSLANTNFVNSFMSLSFDYMVLQDKAEIGMANGTIDTFRNQALINTNAGYSANQRYDAASNCYCNWVEGVPTVGLTNNAVNLYGTNQIATDYATPAGVDPISVSCWVKLRSHRDWATAIRWDNNGFSEIAEMTGGVWSFFVNNSGGGYAHCGVLTTNEWHHLVGVKDTVAGYVAIYHDGVRSNGVNYAAKFGGGTIRFGRGFNPDNVCELDGAIDEVVIWTNRALTDAEVLALYNAGAPVEYDKTGSKVECLWRFDETSGAAAADQMGRANGTLAHDDGDQWVRGIVRSLTPGPAVINDMTLMTTNFPIAFVPSGLRVAVWQQPQEGTTVVNTDFQAWASRDGGTTFDQVILSPADRYYLTAPARRMYAGTVSVANQPAGSGVVIKVTTLNGKGQRIYGIGWIAF